MLSVREISDYIEIAQLLERYGRALDGKDFELLDDVFAPDAVLRYELLGRDERGPFSEWKTTFREFMRPFEWTSHLFSTPAIQLDGDSATTNSRVIATHLQIDHEGGKNLWTVYGFYRDRLVRNNSGWRIRERHFRGPHAEGRPLRADQVRGA